MVIIKEKKQPLMEMAVLKSRDIPSVLRDRTARLVMDEWYYDRLEKPGSLDKVGFRYSFGVDIRATPPLILDFDYGFISRSYKYTRGDAKASGAPSNRNWEFRALHLISNLPGAEGQWGRNTFVDKDFEDIVTYENKLAKESVTDAKTVAKIVRDFKLQKQYGNILQLCNELLK